MTGRRPRKRERGAGVGRAGTQSAAMEGSDSPGGDGERRGRDGEQLQDDVGGAKLGEAVAALALQAGGEALQLRGDVLVLRQRVGDEASEDESQREELPPRLCGRLLLAAGERSLPGERLCAVRGAQRGEERPPGGGAAAAGREPGRTWMACRCRRGPRCCALQGREQRLGREARHGWGGLERAKQRFPRLLLLAFSERAEAPRGHLTASMPQRHPRPPPAVPGGGGAPRLRGRVTFYRPQNHGPAQSTMPSAAPRPRLRHPPRPAVWRPSLARGHSPACRPTPPPRPRTAAGCAAAAPSPSVCHLRRCGRRALDVTSVSGAFSRR